MHWLVVWSTSNLYFPSTKHMLHLMLLQKKVLVGGITLMTTLNKTQETKLYCERLYWKRKKKIKHECIQLIFTFDSQISVRSKFLVVKSVRVFNVHRAKWRLGLRELGGMFVYEFPTHDHRWNRTGIIQGLYRAGLPPFSSVPSQKTWTGYREGKMNIK